jgi:hypothetical protein
VTDAETSAFFAEHGWVIVRGVVPPAHIEALRRAVDRIQAASRPPSPGEVWEVAGVSRASPEIFGHSRDPAVARVAGAALGSARVQLLQDTVLVKPALVGGAVAWHQDHTYTGYLAPARVVSARLALTDDGVAQGCLEVIDGSHAWGPIGDVRALRETRVADALGARAAAWQDRVVAVELHPGDVSLHHCLTFHRSGPNAGATPRKTLITRLFDAACTLDPTHLPPGAAAHFPVDAAGHLDPIAFPLLWPDDAWLAR